MGAHSPSILPSSMLTLFHNALLAVAFLLVYLVYKLVIAPHFDPLRSIAGPKVRGWFANNLHAVLEYAQPALLVLLTIIHLVAPQFPPKYINFISSVTVDPFAYEASVQYAHSTLSLNYLLTPKQWDERLLTLDPLSVSHVLKNSTIYEKPWQSRKLITSLIGCGMLGAEGQVHKRHRRVATPAFSIQNLRALVPLVFQKGTQLKDRWMEMAIQAEESSQNSEIKVDVCHWINRATFDVIGLAGWF